MALEVIWPHIWNQVSIWLLPLTATLMASEAMAASKQPLRSHQISELNSVTSITDLVMLLWPLTGSNDSILPGQLWSIDLCGFAAGKNHWMISASTPDTSVKTSVKTHQDTSAARVSRNVFERNLFRKICILLSENLTAYQRWLSASILIAGPGSEVVPGTSESLDTVEIWTRTVHVKKRLTRFPSLAFTYCAHLLYFTIDVALAPSDPSMLPSKREGEGLSYSGGGNQNRRESSVAMWYEISLTFQTVWSTWSNPQLL